VDARGRALPARRPQPSTGPRWRGPGGGPDLPPL